MSYVLNSHSGAYNIKSLYNLQYYLRSFLFHADRFSGEPGQNKAAHIDIKITPDPDNPAKPWPRQPPAGQSVWCPVKIKLQFTVEGREQKIEMSHSTHVVPDKVAVSVGDDFGIHSVSKVSSTHKKTNGCTHSIICMYIIQVPTGHFLYCSHTTVQLMPGGYG